MRRPRLHPVPLKFIICPSTATTWISQVGPSTQAALTGAGDQASYDELGHVDDVARDPDSEGSRCRDISPFARRTNQLQAALLAWRFVETANRCCGPSAMRQQPPVCFLQNRSAWHKDDWDWLLDFSPQARWCLSPQPAPILRTLAVGWAQDDVGGIERLNYAGTVALDDEVATIEIGPAAVFVPALPTR